MGIPDTFDLFLGGGRAGGKSYLLVLLALRYIAQYLHRARVLFIRESYKALKDLELLLREVIPQAYPGASYNMQEHVWTFPQGGYLELGQLTAEHEYRKYQGRSFGLLLIDEVGEYRTPHLLDKLRSNLRAPAGVPTRVVLAGNPGSRGHYWLAERYVFNGAAPWQPFFEPNSGREWVYVPSTYKENEAIDAADYEKQLRSSCPADPELCRAWLEGDWGVVRGSYFGGVISEERNALPAWGPEEFRTMTEKADHSISHIARLKLGAGGDWRYFLAYDHGYDAPAACYVIAKSPGQTLDGRWFSPGSLLALDELYTCERGDFDRGLHWTVDQIAEAILEMCDRWKIRPAGAADDSIFAESGTASIARAFREAGVYFQKVGKGYRVVGWEKMRTFLKQAGSPDRPGLFISRACKAAWATIPYISRDPRNYGDADTSGADHAADALRYGVLHGTASGGSTRPLWI
jgi:hypothetical protein